ncbi:MAG: hypothetical protein RL071_1855, partial [Pseudomonadota bacterium]
MVQPGQHIAGMRVEVVLDPGPPGPLLRARALDSGRLHLLRLGPPGAAPPVAWVGLDLPGLVPLVAIADHEGAPVLVCAWRPGQPRALRGGPAAVDAAVDAALGLARAGLR